MNHPGLDRVSTAPMSTVFDAPFASGTQFELDGCQGKRIPLPYRVFGSPSTANLQFNLEVAWKPNGTAARVAPAHTVPLHPTWPQADLRWRRRFPPLRVGARPARSPVRFPSPPE